MEVSFATKAPSFYNLLADVLRCRFSIFTYTSSLFSKHNDVHIGQAGQFFIRPEDIAPKSKIFVPMCNSRQWSGISNGSSPAMASFLLCSFQIKSIQNSFTVDIYTRDRPIFSLACFRSRYSAFVTTKKKVFG